MISTELNGKTRNVPGKVQRRKRLFRTFSGKADKNMDTTLFMKMKQDEVDVEKVPSVAELEQEVLPFPVSSNVQLAKLSFKDTSCIFHNLIDRNVVNGNLLRAIQSEIDRHSAEAKKVQTENCFAAKHLQNQNIAAVSAASSKSTVVAANAHPSLFEDHFLAQHASSVDYDIRKELIKPPSGQDEEKIASKRKKAKKMLDRIHDRIKSTEELLKINPFKLNKKLDLLELREMLPKKQTSNRHQMTIIHHRDARIQYQVFNDSRLQGPLFSSKFTDHLPSLTKKSEGCSSTRGRNPNSKPLFRFRDRAQLLAVTRKNHKMQKETKLDVINRIRHTNRCTMSLAIRKRMITFLNQSIIEFDKHITMAEVETEELAKEFDNYLHQNDQKTIMSINRAAASRKKRFTAEMTCKKLATQNNLLNCHNIRSEEKTAIIDRFVNVVYSLIPEESKIQLLKDQSRRREEHKQRNLQRQMHLSTKPKRSLAKSLQIYDTLSDESLDGSNSANSNEISDDEEYELPGFPFESVQDFVPLLKEYTAKSNSLCVHIAETKEQHQQTQNDLAGEVENAKSTLVEAEKVCEERQLEAERLQGELNEIMQRRAATSDDAKSKELFHRPITQLETTLKEIVHKFIQDLTDRYLKVSDLLTIIREKLQQHQNALSRIPQVYILKWYRTVVKNRAAEANLLKTLHKKERRIQRALDRHAQAVSKGPGTKPKFRSHLPQRNKKVQPPQRDLLLIIVEKAEEEREKAGVVTEIPVVFVPEELRLEEEAVEEITEVSTDTLIPEIIVEEPTKEVDELTFEPPFLTNTVHPIFPSESSNSLKNGFHITDTVISLTQVPSDCIFISEVQHFEPEPEFRMMEKLEQSKKMKRLNENGFEVKSNESLGEATKQKRKTLMDDFFDALKVDRLERGLVKSNESLPMTMEVTSAAPETPTITKSTTQKLKHATGKRRKSTSAKTKKAQIKSAKLTFKSLEKIQSIPNIDGQTKTDDSQSALSSLKVIASKVLKG